MKRPLALTMSIGAIAVAVAVCSVLISLWSPANEDRSAAMDTASHIFGRESTDTRPDLSTINATGPPHESVPVSPTLPPDRNDGEQRSLLVDGKVTDSAGEPLPQVEVCEDTDGGISVLSRTNKRGYFRCSARRSSSRFAGDEVEVHLQKDGYATRTLHAAAYTNAVHFGTVELLGCGRISGFVLDSEGTPYEGAKAVLSVAKESCGPSDPLYGPRSDLIEQTVVTGGDGEFHFGNILPGTYRVSAASQTAFYSWTGDIDVFTHKEVGGISLALKEIPSISEVTGVVVYPDDSPAAGAWVSVKWRTAAADHKVHLSSRQCDLEGRFVFCPRESVRHSFSIEDPAGRYHRIYKADVVLDERELTFRFTQEKPSIRLVVRDENGGAVRPFSVFYRRDGEHYAPHMRRQYGDGSLDHDGGASFFAPYQGRDFYIRVCAQRYRNREFGPFNTDSGLPERLDVVLSSVGGVRGRVVTDHGPISDAEVYVLESAPPGQLFRIKGFLARSSPLPLESTKTDETGAFTLWIQKSGMFYFRAEADGYAPSEIGPVEVDWRTLTEDVTIRLSKGGSVEGRLVGPAGIDLFGQNVALSRGGGFPRSATTDKAGRFRCERLTPGFWKIEWRESPLPRGRGGGP